MFTAWSWTDPISLANKSVDIKLSAYDAFLEELSSRDAESQYIGKQNNLRVFGNLKLFMRKKNLQCLIIERFL